MRRIRVVLVLVAAVGLAMGPGFSGVLASHVEPTPVPGNPECSTTNSLKVEPVEGGTYADDSDDNPGDLVVVISNVQQNEDGENTHFDWSSEESGVLVQTVIVKGGPSANVYDYSPEGGSFGDDGLHAPINPNTGQPHELSHVAFCYDDEAPPPPAELALTLSHDGDDTNDVGTDHTVVANLTQDGEPVEGAEVRFEVSRDPEPEGGNPAESGTGTTNVSGDASFTYTGPSEPAVDTIVACVDPDDLTVAPDTCSGEGAEELVVSNEVTKTWVADDDEPAEATFSCRASLLRVENNAILIGLLGEDGDPFEPFVANDAQDPCVADNAGLLQALGLDDDGEIVLGGEEGDPGSIVIRVTTAETSNGTSGNAGADYAKVEIFQAGNPVPVFAAYVLNSSASAACGPDGPELEGSSTVVTLSALGEELAVSDPVTIPLELEGVGSLGTIYLNFQETSEDGTTITQRAIFWDTTGSSLDTEDGNPIGNVIVAEAIADVHGCEATA